MGCSACSNSPASFTLTAGDDVTMNLVVRYLETGDPVDLTNCTAIIVFLQNADGSFASLSIANSDVSITVPANLGKYSVAIASNVSALLNVGVAQSFNVQFTISGKITTVQYSNALTVLQGP